MQNRFDKMSSINNKYKIVLGRKVRPCMIILLIEAEIMWEKLNILMKVPLVY